MERDVSDLVALQVERAYARQSRLIDGGDAAGWAATFTPDGEFHSPSYPEPAAGTDALRAFAQAFADNGLAAQVVSRHVVTNVDVLPRGGRRPPGCPRLPPDRRHPRRRREPPGATDHRDRPARPR